MTKNFCSICGRELMEEPHTRYKVKREWHGWYESGWERLEVHDNCWRKLCKEIVKMKDNEKENNND